MANLDFSKLNLSTSIPTFKEREVILSEKISRVLFATYWSITLAFLFFISQARLYAGPICESSSVGAFEVTGLNLHFSRFKFKGKGEYLQRICQEIGGRLPTIYELKNTNKAKEKLPSLEMKLLFGGERPSWASGSHSDYAYLGGTRTRGSLLDGKFYFKKGKEDWASKNSGSNYRCLVDKDGLHGWDRWILLPDDAMANNPNQAKDICENNQFRIPTHLELREAIAVGVCTLGVDNWQNDFWVESYRSPSRLYFYNSKEETMESTNKTGAKRVVCLKNRLSPILIEKLESASSLESEKEIFERRMSFISKQFVDTKEYILPNKAEAYCRSLGMNLPTEKDILKLKEFIPTDSYIFYNASIEYPWIRKDFLVKRTDSSLTYTRAGFISGGVKEDLAHPVFCLKGTLQLPR